MPHQFVQYKFVQEFVAVSLLIYLYKEKKQTMPKKSA